MLSVENLSVTFKLYERGLTQKNVQVISNLDLDVKAGEVVAVVGSSGSGKSLLAHAVLGILPDNAQVSGTIRFQDELLTPKRAKQLRGRQIFLIPQSINYLNPLLRVGTQVQRVAQLNGLTQAAAAAATEQTFQRYALDSTTRHLFPFQLSGGMARRVLVSTAAVGRADLVIADEPTPGLHADVVKETLSHLRELASEGRAVVLITHDIEAALQIADRVAVFYAGTTVEIANRDDFATNQLRHPYTQALWRSLPQNEFVALPGVQPSPDALPPGCLFGDRCPLATAECHRARPALQWVKGAPVRCIHAEAALVSPQS